MSTNALEKLRRRRGWARGALQKLRPQLIVLPLDARQAPWIVAGRAVAPRRAMTHLVATDVRSWTDRVAEYAIALASTLFGRSEKFRSTRLARPASPAPARRRGSP